MQQRSVNAKLAVIPSIWGRKCASAVSVLPWLTRIIDWAGGPGESKEDVKWIDQRLSEFLW
jgi:hypothetical protein